MRGITKRFPGVLANDGVDLDGSIRGGPGLLGENGAGKSTLMNVSSASTAPTRGGHRARPTVEIHAPR